MQRPQNDDDHSADAYAYAYPSSTRVALAAWLTPTVIGSVLFLLVLLWFLHRRYYGAKRAYVETADFIHV
jgi:hypothetical protein